MQAQGSGLTNKYAEGYPGKRYYGGCEHVDKVERLAIDRARQLFGADYANVQPHSGSSANAAVYLALLNAGDTILGMSLAHGGHLTHGAKVSSSGKLYNAVQYGLDTATGLIDYDEVERLAVEHKPKMIVAGFSAYSKTLDFPRFRAIADKVGAYLFVDMARRKSNASGGLVLGAIFVVILASIPKTVWFLIGIALVLGGIIWLIAKLVADSKPLANRAPPVKVDQVASTKPVKLAKPAKPTKPPTPVAAAPRATKPAPAVGQAQVSPCTEIDLSAFFNLSLDEPEPVLEALPAAAESTKNETRTVEAPTSEAPPRVVQAASS